MFDFRLRVFHTVAKRLNFTKAAAELCITQPAVTKHIHEIEAFYKIKVFERNGTKIKLTPAGTVLLNHTEELFAVYRNIDIDLAALHAEIKGTIRVGASTTVAQYLLPRDLALLKQQFPGMNIELAINNTEHIERLLTENKIDLGFIEGQSRRPHIKYHPFTKDEIVLCTGFDNPLPGKPTITLKELQKLPFIMREQGSGSLEVITKALAKAGVKPSQLPVEIVLENTESIKTYLLHSNAFAFLSVHSILKELKSKELKVVDIKDFSIERYFYFITQQGGHSPLQESFLKFLSSHYRKL